MLDLIELTVKNLNHISQVNLNFFALHGNQA